MSGYQRVKPFLLVTGLQSGSSTNSGGGGTQSTSSNLSQHLTYTSYILKQTPQVGGVSILIEVYQHFRLQWWFVDILWYMKHSWTMGSRSSLTTHANNLSPLPSTSFTACCCYWHISGPHLLLQGGTLMAPCRLRKQHWVRPGQAVGEEETESPKGLQNKRGDMTEMKSYLTQ